MRRGRKLLLGLVIGAVLVVLMEGAASLLLVGHSVVNRTNWRFTERRREITSRFDAELGWTTNENFGDPAGFGPTAPVHTNSQGFRGLEVFERAVPTGRVRALASGDSFTFGTGVGDEQTWCEELERKIPSLETVNLGIGGYGIDQAWLRYRRDGASLDHDLHLFAFITEDILRAVIPATWGAEKPRVTVEGESLVVSGVPVRKASPFARTLRQAGGFLQDLRLVELAGSIAGGKGERPQLSEDDEARGLALAVFADLAKLAKERHCELVLLHLPIESEYFGGSADVLRLYFKKEVARRGVAWIDLFDEFRALSPEEHASLYLRPPAHGAGHYNAKGTGFVAEAIARKLRDLPSVQSRLAASTGNR